MPKVCPHCGAEISPKAKACPRCGSDEKTGWSEDARSDGLDLPEEEFDYEDFAQREFGNKKPIPRGIHPFWWIVALLLVSAFLWLSLRSH